MENRHRSGSADDDDVEQGVDSFQNNLFAPHFKDQARSATGTFPRDGRAKQARSARATDHQQEENIMPGAAPVLGLDATTSDDLEPIEIPETVQAYVVSDNNLNLQERIDQIEQELARQHNNNNNIPGAPVIALPLSSRNKEPKTCSRWLRRRSRCLLLFGVAITLGVVGAVAGLIVRDTDNKQAASNKLPTSSTSAPLQQPTSDPGRDPTAQPSKAATSVPTANPTTSPTNQPTPIPTTSPTVNQDEAIRASVDQSFIDSLDADGRTNLSNDDFAVIKNAADSIVPEETSLVDVYIRGIAKQWREKGYYAVIVNNDPLPKAQGYDYTYSVVHCCSYVVFETTFNVYVGTRDHPMIVENRGARGFRNWVFSYETFDYWVMWEKIVLFVPDWNYDTMGQPREERDRSRFPGWFF